MNSTGFNTFTTQGIFSVCLLFLISQHTGLDIMTADIGNAFPTAPCQEKVYTIAGPEFGDREGSLVEITRALYGLAGLSQEFADFLADLLIDMAFEPSRADPDLWLKKSKHHDGYNYIATHVDNIIVVAQDPQHYLSMIEQHFSLRNIESKPKYYLGTRLTKCPDGMITTNQEEFIKESIQKYKTKHNITLKKKTL